jgi:hypothetical protein
MKRPLLTRAHEWAADNISWVQYPDVIGIKKPFFKHQMPFWKRYLLFVVGIAGLLLSAILLFVIVWIVWAVITA